VTWYFLLYRIFEARYALSDCNRQTKAWPFWGLFMEGGKRLKRNEVNVSDPFSAPAAVGFH